MSGDVASTTTTTTTSHVNSPATETVDIYYAMRSQIGTGAVKHLQHCGQSTWREVRRALEDVILGPVPSDDATDTASADVAGATRRYKRDNTTTLCGQVVANVYSHRSEVPRDSDDWLERAKALPHLLDRSLLETGDVLLLARVPRSAVARDRVYGRGTPAHKVPEQWRHYVRRLQTREERDAARPYLLGRHQWLAPTQSAAASVAVAAASEPEPVLRFDESMNEAARIEAIINYQPYKIDDEAEQREQEQRSGCRDDMRRVSDHRVRRRRGEEPPDHYVCRRCNVPGHWIQDCPTHNDRQYDRATLVPMHGMARSLFRRLEDRSLLADPDAKIYYDQTGRYYIKKTDVVDRARATGNRQFAALVRCTRAVKRTLECADSSAPIKRSKQENI